jgi:WD40 repeat protein
MIRNILIVLSCVLSLAGVSPAGGEVIQPGNVDRLTELGRFGHGVVTAVSFSPDGASVYVDTSTGRFVHSLRSLSAEPRFLAGETPLFLSPDGKVAAFKDRVQRVADGTVLFHLPEKVIPVQFTPDSLVLVVQHGTEENGTPELWRMSDGTPLRTYSDASQVALASDGVTIALGQGSIVSVTNWVRDTTIAVITVTQLTSQQIGLWSLALSPDGRTLAIGVSSDFDPNGKTIGLYRVRDGQLVATIPSPAPIEPFFSEPQAACDELNYVADPPPLPQPTHMTFTHDGRAVIASYFLGRMRAARVSDGRVLRQFDEGVSLYALSPDGRRLITASSDGLVQVWRTSDFALLATLNGYDGAVRNVALSRDGSLLITEYTRHVVVRRTSDGKLLQTYLQARFALSTDEQLIALGYASGRIELRQLQTGMLVRWMTAHAGEVRALAFLSDGQLVSSGTDCANRSWQMPAGRLLRKYADYITPGYFVAETRWRPDSLTASPDGKVVLGGFRTWAWSLGAWQTGDGSFAREITFTYEVRDLAFSPDGTMLAISGSPLELWGLSGGLPTGNPREIIQAGSEAVAFSPDGALIVTGDADGYFGHPERNGVLTFLRVSDGELLGTHGGNSPAVTSLAFSGDGKFIASGSADGTVLVWGVP